jgi:hypothetical protein
VSDARQLCRKAAATPCHRPIGYGPARIGQHPPPFRQRALWIPVIREPFPGLRPDVRRVGLGAHLIDLSTYTPTGNRFGAEPRQATSTRPQRSGPYGP